MGATKKQVLPRPSRFVRLRPFVIRAVEGMWRAGSGREGKQTGVDSAQKDGAFLDGCAPRVASLLPGHPPSKRAERLPARGPNPGARPDPVHDPQENAAH